MISRIVNNRIPHLLTTPNSKFLNVKNNTAKNFDKISISEAGRARVPKTSTLTHEEKVANRRRIDFCEGGISFDNFNLSFALPDGTLIPMEDVATEIGEEEITPFEITDNKVDLKPDTYSKWVGPDGKEHILTITKSTVCLSSCTQDILSDPAFNSQIVSGQHPVDKDTRDSITLLDFLCDESDTGFSVVGIYMFYSDEKVHSLMNSLGFKPGKIETDIGKGSNVYFWDKKDGIYCGSQSESTINAVNHINYIKEFNVPQGAVYRIDGNEYPMDEDGFFHIPSGIMCVPNSMSLVDKDGNPFQLRGW